MAANYQMLFELNAALGGGFTSAFTQGSQQIDNMKAKLDALNSAGSTGDLLGGISSALSTVGVMKGLEEVYDTLKECAQASIEFESAMTGVSKTTDMSASELQAMSEAVMKLSTEIPVTTTELANVMEVAGQLGISKDNLLDFSTTMSQLATATTMTADEAATMLAQFANITQMDPSQYSNLASAVVDLGNNYATTEQKIVDMGQGIAAAGSLAGMSEADMMGLSAAVTSLGIETAAGSTSMSKLISKLNMAVETGDGLEDFASVAGMSAQQFSEAWGNDAANALARFITGLNNVEQNGASASVILGELGIKESRMVRMVLSLAGSGDLMANAIRDANAAFRENTALTAEAEKRYATTESRLKMLSNAANNVKISIGDALTPMVASVSDGLTKLLEPMAEFIEQNPAIVQGLTAFIGVLGLAAAAVAAYTAATKLAAAANLLFGGSIPGIGIIMGVAAGIGALVAGIGLLTDAYNDAHPSFEQLDTDFDSLNEKAKEQQHIIDLAEEYKTLTKEISDLENSGVGEITQKIDISGVKKSDLDLLKEIAENHGYVVNDDGTVTQTLDITGVSKKDLQELERLKKAYVDDKAKLTQELELLGVKDVEKNLPTFLEMKTNTKDGTYKLKQALEIAGAENLTDAKVEQLKRLMNTVGTKEGKLTQKLELLGFDAASISALGYSSMEAFVDAVQSGKIITTADGTLTQKLVMDDIKPEKIKQIQELKESIVNEKATLTQELQLRGVEDVEKNLETYLSFKTNTADGTHALKQQLELDGAENITDEQLRHLKEFISSIQTKTGKLTQTLETSGFDSATISALGYGTMKEFVAAVEAGKVVVNANGTITQTIDVTGELTELKEANEQAVALAEAQNAAASASEELAAKRERLKAVTEELRGASGGLITATDDETDALNRQIEAYENVAKARKDQYTADALDTVKKMSKQYVDSIKAEADASANLTRTQNQQTAVQEFLKAGDAAGYVRSEFDSLVEAVQSYEGEGSWLHDDTEEAKALQNRFYGLQDTINTLTGQDYDFFGSGLAGMGYAVEHETFSVDQMSDSWQSLISTATGYADAVEANDKIQQEYLQNLINGVAEGTLEYDSLEAALNEAYKDYENSGELVAETMEKVRAGVDAAKAAAEGSGSTAQTEAETTVAAVGNIITQMENLKKADDEAKEAAKKSLGSRFGLFDETGDPAQSKTTSEMKTNLAAQQAYWEQYNTALQTVLDKGVSKEIATQLSDGSAESLAALQELAAATPEEVQAINDSFAEVEASKDALASTIADMETQFTEGMTALKTELENTVKELDKGSEAAAAAKATMEAYVKDLTAGGTDATTEAGSIADAVNAALATIADVDVDITYHYKTEGSPPGEASGVQDHDAIGTDYAAAGLTLVGEEGPELVMMNGGEKVLTANETVNALSGGSGEGSNIIEVQFSPVFNVSGGGNASEIRAMLQEQSQSLRDQVEDIMDEVLSDRRRTAYA